MESVRESRIRLTLPVTVLMERRVIARRFWSVPNWRLAGVVCGNDMVHEARAGRRVRRSVEVDGDGRDGGEGGELWSWSGCTVTLYKDACERYWHALVGERPLVHVICLDAAPDPTPAPDADPDEIASVRPLIVTVDHDEAASFVETDERVLSAPIPAELYRHMEAFVLEHYRPREFVKRKRRDWSTDDRHGPRDGGRRSR